MPETLEIGGFQVKVIRRTGLKNMTLRAQSAGEFRLSVPQRLARRHIVDFLESRKDWMLLQNQKYEGLRTWTDRDGSLGEKFWYLGELLTLKEGVTFLKKPVVDFQAPHLWYLWPEKKFASRESAEGRDEVLKTVRAYFHKKAAALILERVEHYANEMGVRPKDVRFRNQRSRWGSCSSRGNLNFNLKLIGAPLDVIDSVVVHELAHLVHLNHSPAFWGLVEKFSPQHERADRWLNEHQMELFA